MESKNIATWLFLALSFTTSTGTSQMYNTDVDSLRQKALDILSWTETKGGELLSRILLSKRQTNGVTTYHASIPTLFQSYMEEIEAKLNEVKSEIDAAINETEIYSFALFFGRRNARRNINKSSLQGKDQIRSNSEQRRSIEEQATSTSVILPPDADPNRLSYDDIFDFIGDYTKAFVVLVEPAVTVITPIVQSLFLLGRDLSSLEANRLNDVMETMSLPQIELQRILTLIQEIKTSVQGKLL